MYLSLWQVPSSHFAPSIPETRGRQCSARDQTTGIDSMLDLWDVAHEHRFEPLGALRMNQDPNILQLLRASGDKRVRVYNLLKVQYISPKDRSHIVSSKV